MRYRPNGSEYCHLFRSLLVVGAVTVLSVLAGLPVRADAATGVPTQRVSPEFREPVTLASKDGVLEVRLIARQCAALLDTVAKPVQNFLLFDYELIRGTASDGKTSGRGLYPAPTLQAYPGETLIVHLDNALTGLTIDDYFSPEYTAANGAVPIYPIQMKSSPLNLHVHGIHVSPKGNADNVMLHVPAGVSNTYTYEIAKNMPQGAYWYHSHLHNPYQRASLYGPGRTAEDRANRWQSAGRYGKPGSDPQYAAPVQRRFRPRRWFGTTQQLELATICQHDRAAQRR